MSPPPPLSHRTGLLLVALAATFWSTSGLYVRNISADLMTMLFWRGLFSSLGVFTLFFIMEGRNAIGILRNLRWPAFLAAALSASGMLNGIGSMRYTTVADSMVIYATVPFVTAGFAYLFIGERPSRSTLVAAAVALAGVLIILWGADNSGASLFGKGLAVAMTLSMAGMTTVMRRYRDVAMLPAMAMSGAICSLFCFFFAEPSSIGLRDLGLCAMFGLLQNASGLAAYAIGSRNIPAAEATLVAALEVPFTPLWTWLFLGETPPDQTLLGGAVVLTALFGHILLELRQAPAADPEPFQAGP
jgi:drug/metabolite transporter (DMT)-like permease